MPIHITQSNTNTNKISFSIKYPIFVHLTFILKNIFTAIN